MPRRSIIVRGIVQGVGFRPFVYRLASEHGLAGFVRNADDAVIIEVEGAAGALDQFARDVVARAPAPAAIETCVSTDVPARGEAAFHIDASASRAGCAQPRDDSAPRLPRMSPDVATCDDCLVDLRDPANRRYGYPFTTCAACGPRLTIITGFPYDRERTTMAAFAMCEACRLEYDNPGDRRFHAESIACPECGPRVRALDSAGAPIGGDPFACAASVLAAGGRAAVKGLGGYHLACDAANAGAVSELRRRKHRDEKPFAVMFESLAAAQAVCHISTEERDVLLSSARPVVIVARRVPAGSGGGAPCEESAPGSHFIGAMLPSTPVHHLLMRAAARPLVMTSGNHSDEPIAFDDADALERLAGIADVFLTNDRPIRVRCDDGVSRVVGGSELPVRRSRGAAPRPVQLPIACARPVLAAGGHLKNTFALGQGRDAFISHHIGDLDDYSAHLAFRRDVERYERIFAVAPRVIAHDLHPGYESTRYAIDRAGREGLETIAVQHHHAHVASCMAEHGLTEPVIGVAFDGTGDGGDGTVWGGEFLVGTAREVRRAAHLRTVRLPGGERAATEPWRMAAAHLLEAGEPLDRLAASLGSHGPRDLRIVERMIARGVNAPVSSSAGRLFDAIAAIAGVCMRMSFEGQAAMRLEELAARAAPDYGYAHAIDDAAGTTEPGSVSVVDTRPMVRAAAADARGGVDPATIARRFHQGLAEAVAATCGRLRTDTGIDAVVLTGGVFLNALLTLDCERQLTAMKFRVFRHHVVPPNDGGLSLGQLAVAAARLQAPASSRESR